MTDYSKEKEALLRVFTTGGSVSPAQLKKILGAAKKAGVGYIHFGSRQDILFPVLAKSLKSESICQDLNLNYELNQVENQNITSSYVASGITASTAWVHSDTYHYILEDFDYQPKIKINIVDPAQKLAPLFTGNLNFIASPIDNYWFLYLSLEKERVFCCPILVFSSQISEVSLFLENMLRLNPNLTHQELTHLLDKEFDLKERKEDLKIPENIFPYYEGFHKMTAGQHWLGLYWRNNQYDIPFMDAMCDLCAETKVGKIGITPWKSFIVKGIPDSQLLKWEKLLGKYGINTRHSSLELYWHTPVIDVDAMELKRFLVRTFDQNDINTLGLSFTVKTMPMNTFSSIIIEQNSSSKYEDEFELFESYTIYHTKNFDPNEQEKVSYAKNVLREDLPALLIQLSRHYYERLQMKTEKTSPSIKNEAFTEQKVTVHQCKACFSIYDPRYGEAHSNIAMGIPFEQLQETYACSLCGSGKNEFLQIVVPHNFYEARF